MPSQRAACALSSALASKDSEDDDEHEIASVTRACHNLANLARYFTLHVGIRYNLYLLDKFSEFKLSNMVQIVLLPYIEIKQLPSSERKV